MHTQNAVWMKAPQSTIFRLAADVAEWPHLLPHYRFVHVLEERPGERLVEMSARRGLIPVTWTARQRLHPAEGLIAYTHLGGPTLGMEVAWHFTSSDGGTRVVIVHDLADPQTSLLRLPLATWIAAEWFIGPIADRTLHHIKLAAEREWAEEAALAREGVEHGA